MLRSLELAGFKSFADRTRFAFDPGVTAVVGPNGSGKSNVVDAIKWILGDQSPKSLRGKEMTDVIFNGSAGRKPAGSAEATLTFCNKSGWLPGAERRDVSVGRKLYRNGDSEYLLNGEAVRLKDVRDVFAGTGAGGAAYAIIEQGRVAQLLEANAAGRRAVFEEAAGVSRYKLKRAEAERTLARVEQNLLRVTDVADGVESQLATARSRAKKAGEWLRLNDELRQWWVGLAADEWRELQRERQAAGGEDAGVHAELAALARAAGERAAAGEKIEADHAAAEADRRAAEAAASSVQQQLAADAAAAASGADRLEDLEEEATRLDADRTAAAVALAEAVAESERDAELLTRADADAAAKRHAAALAGEAVEAAEADADAARGGIDAAREARLDAARASDRAAALADRAAADAGAADDRRARAGETLQRAEAALAEAEAASRSARETATGAADRFAASASNLADWHAARAALLKGREKLNRRLSELRERHGAGAARLAVLDELDARGEGVGVALREVLRRARAATQPPWSLVRGTVADLLDCDIEDAALLEVALGERASLVVIDDFDALLPHLAKHSASYKSRVGYFSRRAFPSTFTSPPQADDSAVALRGLKLIDTRGNGPASLGRQPGVGTTAFTAHPGLTPEARLSLEGLPGVVRRADELVAAGGAFPELAARLLGDTWVVEDLFTAAKLAGGAGRGGRFVTLGGELLHSDGTLVVGPPRGEAALLTRTAERKRLRAELDRTAAGLARDSERRDVLGKSLAETEATLETATHNKEEAAAALAAATAGSNRADAARDAARDARDAAAADAHRAAGRLDERTAAADGAAETSSSLAAELAAAERALAETATAADAADAALAAARAALAAAGADLAKAEQRAEGLRSAHDRLARDAAGRSAAVRDLDGRRAACAARVSQVVRAALNAAARAAERVAERDRLTAEAARVAAAAAELSDRRRAFAAEADRLAARRRLLEETVRGAEDALRGRAAKLDADADRLREEFGVELAELAAVPVAEGGPSALAALANGRDAPPEPGAPATGRADDERAADPATADRSEAPSLALGARGAALPALDAERPALQKKVDSLRAKLRALGAVDPDSLHALDDLESKHGALAKNLADIVEAKRLLEETIRRTNQESKTLFLAQFAEIRGHFRTLFRQLFGGGEGDLALEDESDPLECGVEVHARPPGKEPRNISLLSGGEKTIVCVGLLLAIFKSKPSPFCILDEVDAALDEANIGRFLGVMDDFKRDTQFLMVTHRKPSMTRADVLYGVTMQQSGVSKRLTVRFEDVADDGRIRDAAGDAERADAPASTPLRRAA